MPIIVITASSIQDRRSHGTIRSRRTAQRYTPLAIEGYTASARRFASWLGSAGISIDVIDDDVVRRFAEHRCRCPEAVAAYLTNIRAAPGGSLFSCKGQMSRVIPCVTDIRADCVSGSA